MRIRSKIIALVTAVLASSALAQDNPPALTPAGAAILASKLASEGRPLYDRPGPGAPITFPLAMCTFPGGLCGAVRRDGTVAVPPRYDWVGKFSDGRAAVRSAGLYGFVDEEGREVVKPQYRLVDDFSFGFAQVDIDGKSALIDREGKIAIEPKYGFISAVAPDRFAVSEHRKLGGMAGAEDFMGSMVAYPPSVGMMVGVIGLFLRNGDGPPDLAIEIIDASGQRIGPPARPGPPFDKDDPSISWVRKDDLWGLVRADGSWLVEPRFQTVSSLSYGIAQVTISGKAGYIDRTGNFVIPPAFDRIGWFTRGFDQTWAEQDGIAGVIDGTGKWVFRTDYQQVRQATSFRTTADQSSTVFGWHFKQDGRWGLLDFAGRVVLDANFDQPVGACGGDQLEAYRNKEWFYYKTDGTPMQPPDGRLIDAGCKGARPPFAMKVGNKFQLVDINSKPLTPLWYDEVRWAGIGAKNVKFNGKWGRVGEDGSWLLEPKYDYLSAERDVFVASLDGKRGFMRSDGSWLIEPKFDAAARRQDSSTAFVTLAGDTGVMRLADQSWIVPPRPGVVCDIRHAIMREAHGKRSILSETGATWIDIGAERVGANLEFGLVTFLKERKWGLVDTAGQITVEPQFEEPVYFSSNLRGIAWAKREGKWCAIDRHGRNVPGVPCSDANPTGPGNWQVCKVER